MKETTELSLKSSDKKVILAGGVLIGIIIGAALPYIWKLVERFDDLPFYKVLSFLMSFQSHWITIARPAVFALIGLFLAAILLDTIPRLIVSDEKIEVYKGSNRRIIKRAQIAGMYLSGSKLIIESDQGRRLFEDNAEGGKDRVAEAFKKHGYPWES